MAQAMATQGSSFTLRGGLACMIFVLLVSPLAAFFIDNEGEGPIVAIQLPISANSYLEVIPPATLSDCDWTECGQYSVSPGRCDPAYVCIFQDNLGVDWNTLIKSDVNTTAVVNNATQYLGFTIADGELRAANPDAANTILNALPCYGLIVTYNDGGIYFGKLLDTDIFDRVFGFWTIDQLIPPPGTPNCTFNYTGLY